jgi:hypothetical protein
MARRSPVGSANTVTQVRYHELRAESRDAGGTLVDSLLVRFIVRDSDREGSEDGIPPHTPFRSVPDAPSAFVGKTLKVSAPAAWPVGMPVPLVVMLRDGANESVWLNGVVKFGGFPADDDADAARLGIRCKCRRGLPRGRSISPASVNSLSRAARSLSRQLPHSPR